MHWKLRIVEEMQTLQCKNCICTDGKVLWSGNQQLRATTPANWYWQVKAVYNDKAPPWKEQIRQRFSVLYICANTMLELWDVPNLREAAKDYTMRGDPVLGLMFNYGLD